MTTHLLLTNGYVHSVPEPYANALHVDNGVIAWLGSDEAGQQLVAATVTEPVETYDLGGRLVTPAFIDGLSTTEITHGDSRVSLSSTKPTEHGVYYTPLDAESLQGDGFYVAENQIDQLEGLLGEVKPPTQLMIESRDAEQLDQILGVLAQQKTATLMRARHRIVANHPMDTEHIDQLVTVHASVTVTPDIGDTGPTFTAPVASLIARGVHVATGTGQWTGSVWEVVTALIEHNDPKQRISTRAAFNTVSRDGVRVWPSRIAQANMAAGQIAVGSPADFNVWAVDQLGVQAPDVKSAHWSTDKRAGTALLPILSSAEELPELQWTIRNGQVF